MAKEKDIKKKDVKKVNSKKNVKNNKPKEKFTEGIKKELKLVKWPTVKEILKYTLATVIFCIILVAFFEVLNLVMAFIKGMFN
ncbi:MAG: preprotein translocase subunit SecE [Firmicutes bacterium]|nr:preprotein translocase subunit SecE [Bacillota bacterium]